MSLSKRLISYLLTINKALNAFSVREFHKAFRAIFIPFFNIPTVFSTLPALALGSVFSISLRISALTQPMNSELQRCNIDLDRSEFR